ncbi:hypothetical protein BKA70DRAFT_1226308 [Coprinopsis sp. MPI-PUGE-AT-0042]|nr:hypothetical protein BKA70DRAFT_1226308 [Coprinopsis sp. MPI-PUGE-AT-0042]
MPEKRAGRGEVLMAIILCAVEDRGARKQALGSTPRAFAYGGVTIDVDKDSTSGVVVAHLSITTDECRRNLSKPEIENLLSGYPPFWRTMLTCNGDTFTSQVRGDDIFRGGWVVGVGLSEEAPVPLYMAIEGRMKSNTDGSRGGVFVESLNRVRDILVKIIQPMYPNDATVQEATDAVVKMVAENSDSSFPEWLGYNQKTLTRTECTLAMQLFNLGRSDKRKGERFRELLDVERVRRGVVEAAYRGVHRNKEYFPTFSVDEPQKCWEEYQNTERKSRSHTAPCLQIRHPDGLMITAPPTSLFSSAPRIAEGPTRWVKTYQNSRLSSSKGLEADNKPFRTPAMPVQRRSLWSLCLCGTQRTLRKYGEIWASSSLQDSSPNFALPALIHGHPVDLVEACIGSSTLCKWARQERFQ